MKDIYAGWKAEIEAVNWHNVFVRPAPVMNLWDRLPRCAGRGLRLGAPRFTTIGRAAHEEAIDHV